MEHVYDPDWTLTGWFDPELEVEGWFDGDFTADAGGPTRDGPTYKSSATANSGTGTSSTVSIDLPTGLNDGDVGYLLVSVNTNTERDDPGGVWNELDYQTLGTVLGAKVYRADLLATDSGDTLSWGLGAAQKWNAVVIVVENDGGVDTDTEQWTNGSSHTAWTLGAVTPTVDDTLLVGFHVWRRAVSGTTTSTPPTGWTEAAETSQNAASSPTNGAGILYQEITGGSGVSSGADTDGGYDGTASDGISFVLAVKPVAGGTPATASGSITLAGSAAAAGAATAAGSLTLGGSATARAAAMATGSLTLGGSGTAQGAASATGSVTLGGSATWVVPSATGSVTLGGSATAQGAATVSGSITLAGSATAVDSTGSTASGSITLAGSATAQAAATASGSITLGGSATARAAATATGSITLGGSATGQAPLTATGSVTLGGSATAQARATASGSVTLTATAGAQGRATATGSITLTGTADAAAGGGLIPGFARETFPARTKASLTLTGTTARDTVRAGTTVRFGGSGARTHEFTPSHVTAKEPQHV